MSSDKIFALYVFCAHFHDGQNSRLYRLGSRIARRYGPHLTDNTWRAVCSGVGEWETAHELYATMVRNFRKGCYHA